MILVLCLSFSRHYIRQHSDSLVIRCSLRHADRGRMAFDFLCFRYVPQIKVWVLTVDKCDVKRYICTEAICEFTPS